MSTAVFTFGRMNPPTIGHEKLVNKLRKVARLIRGQPFIYLSHSQDAKKNPLDYNSKIKISQSAFGAIAKRSTSNTIMKVMAELEAAKFTDVVLVAGSDRVKSFDQLLQQYNGKDYKCCGVCNQPLSYPWGLCMDINNKSNIFFNPVTCVFHYSCISR